MAPKFANPHSLSQDVETTTRSEIAERAGSALFVRDEDTRLLERGLDDMLRDTWAATLALETPKAKTHRRTSDNRTDDDATFEFRLVSSVKHAQRISLDPKPPPPPFVSRGPDCEDDDIQAETRRTRALSVAVEYGSLIEAAVSAWQVDPEPRPAVETKVPLSNIPLAGPLLPALLVTEEVHVRKTDCRNRMRDLPASESFAVSPHEPRLSCVEVLPVTSVSDRSETASIRGGKAVKERRPPAYWRPSAGLRGGCMGYALGYPSSWAPLERYVRDGMKGGWTSVAVHDHPR